MGDVQRIVPFDRGGTISVMLNWLLTGRPDLTIHIDVPVKHVGPWQFKVGDKCYRVEEVWLSDSPKLPLLGLERWATFLYQVLERRSLDCFMAFRRYQSVQLGISRAPVKRAHFDGARISYIPYGVSPSTHVPISTPIESLHSVQFWFEEFYRDFAQDHPDASRLRQVEIL
jgi:hypothetical protein